ncbi:NADH-cytochrome b5 reductase-like [Coemansia sp. RSA 2706]|nr:NADH-cytochrome b5 reductase-like [Coemansia sp. RSA 2706]KAJ2315478.1 NADH-cytochrome b5 reductase-like [Coemansia sp. RSA 2705]KAJ2322253.1 NADH-cytochrome b5 reductase-like [Coemansia sp. RSA 2704]KAJ2329935.1 NADH-cytochrome b5 reductase-like [Coemansia sp. RSA 2702]
MSKPLNPAVEALMQEIARAKLRAEERRQQKLEQSRQQYGVIQTDSGQIKLQLPPPPTKPSPDECCNSGCTPCIMDTYSSQLHAYEENVARLRQQYQQQISGELPSCHLAEPLSFGLLDPLKFTGVRVMHVDTPTNDTRILVLEATAADFVLALGEHVQIRADLKDGPLTRPFTPVMIPAHDGTVRPHIFVRLYANPLSSHLGRLQAGDRLKLRGPLRTHENLTWLFSAPVCVLAAAGTGIAPIFQALEFARLNSSYQTRRIVLVQCARNASEQWLERNIRDMQMPRLEYHVFLSNTHRLTDEKLRQLLDEECADARALICGPGTFNVDVSSWLAGIGIRDVQCL